MARHVGPAAEVQLDLGAHPRVAHLRDRLRVPHRADDHVLESRAHRRLDSGHHVLRGARAAVVGVVEEDDRTVIERARLVERLLDGPVAIDERLALRPHPVEQPVADLVGEAAVAVGHHHRGVAGVGDVGEGEAAEDGGGEDPFVRFRLAAHRDERAHRLVVGALAQRLRKQVDPAPGDHRIHAPVDRVEHHPADPFRHLVHVHVRVGLVADEGGAVLDHRGGQVAVEVAGDRDGQAGGDVAHPPQQLALAVERVLGHHRAVEIEKHRVAAARHRVADQLRHPLVGVLAHRSRGHRLRRERGDDLRASLPGERHVRGDRHAGAGVCVLHRFADVCAPRLEPRPVGDDGREGVGLVLHHRDDDAHDRHPGRGPASGRSLPLNRRQSVTPT